MFMFTIGADTGLQLHLFGFNCRFRAPNFVQIIGPPLHHTDALFPVLCPGVSAPNVVLFNMGQLSLLRLDATCRIHSTELMPLLGNREPLLFLAVTHATQGGVKCIVGNRTRTRSHTWKQQRLAAGNVSEIGQDFDGLPRKCNAVRPPHFHACFRDGPHRTFEVELFLSGGSQLAGAGKQ